MLIIGTLLLLLANACTLNSDKSILFNRVVVCVLLLALSLLITSRAHSCLFQKIETISGLLGENKWSHVRWPALTKEGMCLL